MATNSKGSLVQRVISCSMYEEAFERVQEALECGCIDKIEDARDALVRVMEEAGHSPRRLR